MAAERLLGYLGFVALLALAFIKPLVALAIHAAGSDIHSHILLIPFISLYLIFIRRSQLPKNYATSPRYRVARVRSRAGGPDCCVELS